MIHPKWLIRYLAADEASSALFLYCFIVLVNSKAVLAESALSTPLRILVMVLLALVRSIPWITLIPGPNIVLVA